MPTQVHALTVRDDTGAVRTLQVLTRTSNGASSAASSPAEYLLEGVPVEKVGDKSYRVTTTGIQLTEVDPSEEA